MKLCALILALLLPRHARAPSLAWDYPYATNSIVFNVYSTTNLATPMTWRATVNQPVFYFVADKPQEFFIVTASNTITGQESSPATTGNPQPNTKAPPMLQSGGSWIPNNF